MAKFVSAISFVIGFPACVIACVIYVPRVHLVCTEAWPGLVSVCAAALNTLWQHRSDHSSRAEVLLQFSALADGLAFHVWWHVASSFC